MLETFSLNNYTNFFFIFFIVSLSITIFNIASAQELTKNQYNLSYLSNSPILEINNIFQSSDTYYKVLAGANDVYLIKSGCSDIASPDCITINNRIDDIEIPISDWIVFPKAVVSEENIYVIWVDRNGTLSLRISNDNGKNFGNITTTNWKIPISNDYMFPDNRLNMAVESSKDGIYILFYNRLSAFFTSITDDGKSFGNLTTISNQTDSEFRSTYDSPIKNIKLIQSNKNIYIIWDQASIDNKENITLRMSNDNGKSFGNLTTINYSEDHKQSDASTFDNNVYLVGVSKGTNQSNNIYFVKSHNNGKTFTQPLNIDKTNSIQDIVITADKNNVYLAWISENPFNIYFTRSINNGTSFEDPIKLMGNKSSYSPYISSTKNLDLFVSENIIYVVSWFEYWRSHSYDEEILISTSNNNGSIFSNPLLFNDYAEGFNVSFNNGELYLLMGEYPQNLYRISVFRY